MLLVYCAAMLPVFYRDIAQLARGSDFGLLMAARITLVEDIKAGQIPYSSIFSSSAPSVANLTAIAFVADRRPRIQIVGAIILAFVFGLLTTGRIFLMQLGVGIAFAYLVRQPKLSFSIGAKKLFPVVIVASILFVGLMFFTKVDSLESTALKFAGEHFTWYVIGSTPALDAVVSKTTNIVLQENPVQTAQYISPYVYVPFPMNTFTFYAPYFVALGIVGTFTAVIFIGAVNGYLYALARKGRPTAVFLFAFFMYPLSMTFFVDQYSGSMLTRYLQVALFMAVYFGLLRRIPALDRPLTYRKSHPV
jgi:oligosaccharide repeat unit polymerase